MIFFDVTKAAASGHRSGLQRVSSRLRETLGSRAHAVVWRDAAWRDAVTGQPLAPAAADWLLTPELFCEAERPGFDAFLRNRPCRIAAIFHDAIPLKFPHITWPQSVARHPAYMKQLAAFDRVWAVSAASAEELRGFWAWQGVTPRAAAIEVLKLGADFDGSPRQPPASAQNAPALLCIGILEPRKNQTLLLDVAEQLWTEGRRFELHLVGRVNPHFGQPIAARARALARRFPGLKFHEAATDETVRQLYARATVTLFPTLAEGCGLPLLESLWRGLPCVCSDLPVLAENAAAGGCLRVATDDRVAWANALCHLLDDSSVLTRLRAELTARALPTWADCAAQVLT